MNDIVAIGALDGVRAFGLSVPEDIWIFGHDDIPMSSWHCVNLTTVQQPLEAMVQAAVERMCARLQSNGLEPERKVLPFGLVFRGSTG